MTLSDGSRVWLNAGSSITYPVAFVGNERKVQINGEGYFEVAHNADKPFVVSKGDVSVTVLGTHFNVNAYDDESDVRVTLLEGSVEVKSKVGSGKSKVIKPGEQAKVISNGQLTISKDVDLDEVMAWKNQQFIFERLDLASIMRQLSRWYDIEVNYEGKMPSNKFSGIISRTRNISAVLEMLKGTGDLQFKVDGKIVTVLNTP
jgi:ferric-dicitrate binding protein FerR (iron transport regulator)